jgi:hypothetical protein
MRVYRVVGESAAQSRMDVAGGTGLTPLVGREHEVGLLRERWAQSRDGLGQVVLLSARRGLANLVWCACSLNMWRTRGRRG